MATHRRSRTHRAKRPEWWGWPAVGGIGLGAAAVVLLALYVLCRTEVICTLPCEVDPESLCPTECKLSKVTAILVDTTDRIGAISRADILSRLGDLAGSSQSREKVLIYRTTPVYAGPENDGNPFPPIHTVCNPGHPEEANVLLQNPAVVLRRFEEFRHRLSTVFSDLINRGEPADESPLMENVQAISVTELARLENAQTPKWLILISDLLQHSENLTLYGGLPDPDDFAGTSGGVALRTNLQDVHVEVLFVERREHDRFGSTRLLINFWDRWIDDQEGELTRVSRVDGLN